MCQRKPGPRCSNHGRMRMVGTQKRFEEANAKFTAMLDEFNKMQERGETPSRVFTRKLNQLHKKERKAAREFREARHQYGSTPAGIEELESKLRQHSGKEVQAQKDLDALPLTADPEARKEAERRVWREGMMRKKYGARLDDANRRREFDQKALKKEKERENALVRVETALASGDEEEFKRELEHMKNSYSPVVDVHDMRRENDRYTVPVGKMPSHARTFDVNLPHGGTAQITVTRKEGEDTDVYTSSVIITPTKKDAPGDTRDGFGNYAPSSAEDDHEKSKMSYDHSLGVKEQGAIDTLFKLSAEAGLKNKLFEVHNAHCDVLAKKFREKHRAK